MKQVPVEMADFTAEDHAIMDSIWRDIQTGKFKLPPVNYGVYDDEVQQSPVPAVQSPIPEEVLPRRLPRDEQPPVLVNMTLNLPTGAIQVNVPAQPAPVVNVAAPEVTVNVPESPAPVVPVTVAVPTQPAPVVNVNVPEQKPREIIIRKENDREWRGESNPE